MGIHEVRYFFDLLSLVVAILLLISVLLGLRKKPLPKRRNAALSGLFASMGETLGFFTSDLAHFLIVAAFSGASTYFFILFLDVSRNVLNKDVDYGKYLAFECSFVLALSNFMIYPLVRYMSRGDFSDLATLFVTISILLLGIYFSSSLIKREKSWTTLTLEERRKYYHVKELFLGFSLSLGLWASYFLSKMMLFFGSIQVMKTIPSSVMFRQRFTSMLAKLNVLWRTFRERRQTIKTNVWQNLTSIQYFPSGYVYGWILTVSSILVAMNLRFLDPLQTSQVFVTLMSFLPALFAYLCLKNSSPERFAFPLILSPWIVILACVWCFPLSSPVQNATRLMLTTLYPEWPSARVNAYGSFTSSYLCSLLIIVPSVMAYFYTKTGSALLKHNRSLFRKWVKIFYLSEFLTIGGMTAPAIWKALELSSAYYATNISMVLILQVWALVYIPFLSFVGALIYFVPYRTHIRSTLDLMKEPE